MAERGGFEPPLRVTVNTLSKRAVSATHPPLQRRVNCVEYSGANTRPGGRSIPSEKNLESRSQLGQTAGEVITQLGFEAEKRVDDLSHRVVGVGHAPSDLGV